MKGAHWNVKQYNQIFSQTANECGDAAAKVYLYCVRVKNADTIRNFVLPLI